MSDALADALPLVAGEAPATVFVPETLEELQEIVRRRDGLTLVPAGGRTQLALGNGPRRPFALLDLSHALRGQLEHQEADLTLVAPASATLVEVDALLAEHGQFLPLDPPLPDKATLGGTLAAAISGPLRTKYGLPRDLVLGMTVLRADGELVKAGGRVVKNVTGYDMMRLWCGSLGTLGIITEVALRVYPRPEAIDLAAHAETVADVMEMARELLVADVRPEFLEVVAEGDAWRMVGRIPAAAVAALERERPGVWQPAEGELYRAIRDAGSTGSVAVARVQTLPSMVAEAAAVLAELTPSWTTLRPLTGGLRVGWDGAALPPIETFVAGVARLRKLVQAGGGSVTIEQMPDGFRGELDAWGPPGPAFALMERTKLAYDPDGRLNRGRYIGGL